LTLCDYYRVADLLSRSLREAASRGVRYDKYFALGKFSRHIFNRQLHSAMRAENYFASLQLFTATFLLHFSPQWCFSISQQVFGKRPRIARSCPVAASCLMVLPSSTCLLSTLNALKDF
jgi:hypothetical protein